MRHIFLPIALTASLGAGSLFAQQSEPPTEETENPDSAAQVAESESPEAEAEAEGLTDGTGEAA